jgi:hypothetical protein
VNNFILYLLVMERSALNTILAVSVPSVLSFIFALILYAMKKRYDARQEALNRSYESERTALRLEHDEERQELATRIAATAAMAARITEAETKLRVFEAQASPINAAFAALLVKEMTHFHTPVMDALLAKTPPAQATITEEELVELIAALKQRMEDMGSEISDDERDAAEIFPPLLRRVKREAARIASGEVFTDVRVVGLFHEAENGS